MAIGIGRRQLISALGGAAAWPLAARAQQPMLAGAGSLGTAGSIYPFPNALNTGVRGGISGLPAYTGANPVTVDGTTISGHSFKSNLNINANNVTVEDCYFAVSGVNANCINIENATTTLGTLISHCEMAGETIAGTTGNGSTPGGDAIYASNCTITGCNIHGYAKMIYCQGDSVGSGPTGNVTATGNYCWNLHSSGEHTECVFIDGSPEGLSNCIFTSNTFVAPSGDPHVSGAVWVSNDFGPTSNISWIGNLIVGGGYSCSVGGPRATQITFNNNVVGAGKYGYFSSSKAYNTGSGNWDYLTGQTVAQGANNAPNPNIVIASFAPTNSFTIDDPTFAQNIATAAAITLKGCTLAGHEVQLYDGSMLLGTTRANVRTGVWTFQVPQTGTLAPGVHGFTAKDTTANTTSAVFNVTIPL